MLSGEFELVDSAEVESKDTSVEDLRENPSSASESELQSASVPGEESAEQSDRKKGTDDAVLLEAATSEPQQPIVHTSVKKSNSSSSKSSRKPIARIAEPTIAPPEDKTVKEKVVSTDPVRSQLASLV